MSVSHIRERPGEPGPGDASPRRGDHLGSGQGNRLHDRLACEDREVMS
ncbi:hypothetical protein CSE45_3829 [Citreicella sp. SE45]|nr:hypothetical protein CSE45_3829 [Citreicella sp. SE45]